MSCAALATTRAIPRGSKVRAHGSPSGSLDMGVATLVAFVAMAAAKVDAGRGTVGVGGMGEGTLFCCEWAAVF